MMEVYQTRITGRIEVTYMAIDPNKKFKRALVFGVFDGLHDGHKHFLSQALERCHKLVVVAALPEMARSLKGRPPVHSFKERADKLRSFHPHIKVVEGDAVPGTWKVLDDIEPDIIFLGYDQKGIERELRRMRISFVLIDSYKPEVYKSSLLRSS
jgi:cytidyltransferase-like protein